ncbi:MAG: DUF2934 domain-containing protein [Gammaproteobacteria bacterium]
MTTTAVASTKQAARATAAPSRTAESRSRAYSGEDRYRMIAEAAYFRAERRGFVSGGELQDWLDAELEVDDLLGEDGPR